MSLLTRGGYVVDEGDFEPWHADELTVQANKNPFFKEDPQPFPVFECRGDGTVAVPRFWGDENFGRPKAEFGHVEKAPRLVFNGELRSSAQKDAVEKATHHLRSRGGGILSSKTGFGKCHAKDTPILMCDGSVKLVQDVEEFDLLMGDDSTPRRVLSLARGVDHMYDIIPTKGEKYTVNEGHILVLKNTIKKPYIDYRNDRWTVVWWENCCIRTKVHHTAQSAELFKAIVAQVHQSTIEISVEDYIAQTKTFKHCFKGFRVPVDFDEVALPMDPYMIGVWLGDGTSRAAHITTQDGIILQYFVENLEEYGLYLSSSQTKYVYNILSVFTRNKFMRTLRDLDMLQNKHVPTIYKCNSRANRLLLLAGILDADGHQHDCCFELVQKSEILIDDVMYICRSLGLSCYKTKTIKGCWYKGEYMKNDYFRICIYGNGIDEIPTLLPHKQAAKRSQIKDNLVTGIKVKYRGIDRYYGFTLDGNRRYLLGDFTVTHNTVVSLCVACAMGLKTMVVVHKQFLMDQWEERIRKFVPLARVGRLQQNIEDVDQCDIVVGMLQSIAMREYDEDVFEDFGLVIFDEVHVVPAPVFSRALLKLCTPYVLGLSATPERRDGLTRVIHWFVGPTFFEHALSGEDRVTVRVVNFRLNRALPMNTVAAATIVCAMPDRNAMIVDRVAGLVFAGHKVLLLSDRRAHCENLKLSLRKINVDAALYLGGMKNYELKKSEEARVLLGTYALAREGLDIPSLDALVLATPRSDVTQACGRILHGRTDMPPVIVDIVDQWFLGKAQHKKRLVYYKSSGFNIA